MSTVRLQELMSTIRESTRADESAQAQELFFKTLLDSTVYAHVPPIAPPPGKMRFVQFVRPDNGQTVLPFFIDRAQAEEAAAGRVGIVAMVGRELFKLTRGATLMLNPNGERATLYPPEINALLDGRPLGFATQEHLQESEDVGVCPPSIDTDDLVIALRELYGNEPAVRAAYLVEVHRQGERAETFLLLVIVVTASHQERIVQLTTLAIQPAMPTLALPLSMTCSAPEGDLPELCRHGIQFYGT